MKGFHPIQWTANQCNAVTVKQLKELKRGGALGDILATRFLRKYLGLVEPATGILSGEKTINAPLNDAILRREMENLAAMIPLELAKSFIKIMSDAITKHGASPFSAPGAVYCNRVRGVYSDLPSLDVIRINNNENGKLTSVDLHSAPFEAFMKTYQKDGMPTTASEDIAVTSARILFSCRVPAQKIRETLQLLSEPANKANKIASEA